MSKSIEEMASTTKAAAIEEMKAELEQAGYKIGRSEYGHPDDYPPEYYGWIELSQPELNIELGVTTFNNYSSERQSIDEAVKLAYRHLKQSQFLARLAELREEYQNKPEDAALGNIEQDIVNLVLGYKDE